MDHACCKTRQNVEAAALRRASHRLFQRQGNDRTFGEESKPQPDSPSKEEKEETSIRNTSSPPGPLGGAYTHPDPRVASGPAGAAAG